MPVGIDGRASRRPLPRQLDMSGWSVDTANSSSKPDSNSIGSSLAGSRDINYYKTRDSSSRYGNDREDESHPRQTSSREELSPLRDTSSISSGRSSISSSMFDAGMPRISDRPRESRSNLSYMGDRGELRNIHDNQREEGDRYGVTELNLVDQARRSEHSVENSLRPSSERSGTRSEDVSTFFRGELNSRGSYRNARGDEHSELKFTGSKADSIREAESISRSRAASKVKGSRREKNKIIRHALEIVVPVDTNQDELHSPTDSETTISPLSPSSNTSIPSPVCTNKKTRVSSPCSSISTDRTSTSRVSENKSTLPISRKTESVKTELREDLYAFRKQMREVFIRVEDMVDVHRSFFKCDPSTGSPVLNGDLQQEAEQLAIEAFKQLADLRQHFTRLAKEFQRSEEKTKNSSPSSQHRRKRSSPLKKVGHSLLSQVSDNEDPSSKCIELIEDNGRDGGDEEVYTTERRSSSIRHVSSQNDNNDAPVDDDSARSSVSTYLSQLQSQYQDSSTIDADSVVPTQSATFSTRTRGLSSSIVSDASSLSDQHRSFSTQSSDTDSIFKDFDKRMEEIRCSLNAIASGTTPVSVAAPPIFFQPQVDSPIRTRATLREASRISTRIDGGSPNSEHDAIARVGSREAELRHLLRELNHIDD